MSNDNLPDGLDTPLVEGGIWPQNRASSDFDPSILPEEAFDYLSLKQQAGEYIFDTGNYIGMIPCRDGTTITVREKTTIRNLGSLLVRSGYFPSESDDPFDEDAPIRGVNDPANIEEVLATNFLSSVDKITRYGHLERTEQRDVESDRIRGRINKTEYAMNVARNRPTDIPQTVRDETVDNIENRFIKATLAHLETRPLQSVGEGEIRRRIRTFDEITDIEITPKMVDEVRHLVEDNSIPVTRDYYRSALTLALLLVTGGDISLTEGNQITDSQECFMLPTPNIYEDYVRAAVRSSLSETDYSVYNGNKTRKRTLYTEESPYQHQLEPDIVVCDGDDEPVLVLDAKYTTDPSDHYKIHTYKTRYEVSVAGLVALSDEQTAAPHTKHYHLHGVPDTIDIVRLWLDDCRRSERLLTDYLGTNLTEFHP